MVDHKRNQIRILMVEDSPLDRELARVRLQKEGLQSDLVMVETREDFIAHISGDSYDLVLADYNVPGFSGLEALTIARHYKPAIPFIFVSGALGEELAIDTLHQGATDYVLKQRLERLVPSIRRALAEKEEHNSRLVAERKAQENEERFQTLTDFLPQMVWTMTAEGELNYTNSSWQRFMPADARYWLEERFIHPNERAYCADLWAAAREKNRPFSLECRYKSNGPDQYKWFSLHVVPYGGSKDASRCWLGTAMDIDEEKKKADALRNAEKLAVSGRMAATIAHEINNPLETLVNVNYLLMQEHGFSQKVREYLEIAQNELQRVSAIAKQTLTFYRHTDEVASLPAIALLKETTGLFVPHLRAKNVRFSVDGDPSVRFYGAWGEIRQVVINLLSNAIDAVPTGGSIGLRAAETRIGQNCYAELRIEDNGPGIPPEHTERIFEPFFSTKGVHGTGLGLWVSKGIAEKFGGTLAFSKQVVEGQKGTVAILRLPCEPPDSSETNEEERLTA